MKAKVSVEIGIGKRGSSRTQTADNETSCYVARRADMKQRLIIEMIGDLIIRATTHNKPDVARFYSSCINMRLRT